MHDSEWEQRRAALAAELKRLPPHSQLLRYGAEIRFETVDCTLAPAVHEVTLSAFTEFRGILDPPNGSDFETVEDVANQITAGGALVGYLGDQPVSSLRITFYPDHMGIGRVGVVPACRSRGIGAAMMRYAEEAAAFLNIPEIRLGTREKLTSNVALYVRLGYTIVRRQPHPRGPDIVVLFSKLTSASGVES